MAYLLTLKVNMLEKKQIPVLKTDREKPSFIYFFPSKQIFLHYQTSASLTKCQPADLGGNP